MMWQELDITSLFIKSLINPKYIFKELKPELIDEWQLVPEIWDSVRHACDEDKKRKIYFNRRHLKKRR